MARDHRHGQVGAIRSDTAIGPEPGPPPEAASGVSGSVGDPDVACAVFIQHPCDGSAFGGGGQGGWERSTHHLFERKAHGDGGEGEGTSKKKAGQIANAHS